jgi:hypothetical protein
VHHGQDVVAGLLIGLVAGALAIALVEFVVLTRQRRVAPVRGGPARAAPRRIATDPRIDDALIGPHGCTGHTDRVRRESGDACEERTWAQEPPS